MTSDPGIKEVVARNIWRTRRGRGLTTRDLSERLEEVGHPLDQSAISRVEGQRRRVDVEDLVGFALALNTSPSFLLAAVGPDPLDMEEDEPLIALTPRVRVSAYFAGEWCRGRLPIGPIHVPSDDEAEGEEPFDPQRVRAAGEEHSRAFFDFAPDYERRRQELQKQPVMRALEMLERDIVTAAEASLNSDTGSHTLALGLRQGLERLSQYVLLLADEMESRAEAKNE